MSQGNLTGRKVLVVEDDYLQAKTFAQALVEHGAEVVGPFSAPEECFCYCNRDLIDAAVLDVKVRNTDSFAVADRLVREEIPFIFLTGYDRNSIPHRFHRVPHYLKSFVGTDGPAAVALALASVQKPSRPSGR
ncbi:response regulator [Neorhizobium sp. P12A]|uniref:response regulator n=1 Tax=Neorhizobium sp. P12A TaxID=2268027 RepID=UPI00165E13BA|nr:response regulator [Neorhizobium sp. P12A]